METATLYPFTFTFKTSTRGTALTWVRFYPSIEAAKAYAPAVVRGAFPKATEPVIVLAAGFYPA